MTLQPAAPAASTNKLTLTNEVTRVDMRTSANPRRATHVPQRDNEVPLVGCGFSGHSPRSEHRISEAPLGSPKAAAWAPSTDARESARELTL